MRRSAGKPGLPQKLMAANTDQLNKDFSTRICEGTGSTAAGTAAAHFIVVSPGNRRQLAVHDSACPTPPTLHGSFALTHHAASMAHFVSLVTGLIIDPRSHIIGYG